jgi:hydroxymethylbilane synthase
LSGTSTPRVLRIATRESPLALWQANFVAEELRRVAPGIDVELVPLTTLGDRDRSGPLAQIGGEGLFTREVQRAVLDGHADLAVHSLKDLPTENAPGLSLAGVPARAPRFDALLLPHGEEGSLESLPQGAKIGCGSPRRRAQLWRARPDLKLLDIRGNLDTRIRKLDEGEYDAILLAEAGLRRLALPGRIAQVLAPPVMYPAVGQAALGIECRADDNPTQNILAQLTDPRSLAEVLAERACLRTLRAGCHAPLGVLSSIDETSLRLEAVVLSLDGAQVYQASAGGDVNAAEQTGVSVAKLLIEQGADAVLTGQTQP